MCRRTVLLAALTALCPLLPIPGLPIGATPAAAFDPRKSIGQYVYEVWGTREGLPVSSVQCVERTADGYLWVGTEGGLLRFDGVQFTLMDRRRYPDLRADIFTLRASRDALWVGTDRGLVRFRNGVTTRYSTAEGLADNRVIGMFLDRDEVLWICTRAGLSRFSGGVFTNYTTKNGLPHDIVQNATQSRDGSLWIATNGGLAHLEQGRVTGVISKKDGLGTDLVQSVHEDRQGVLWVGTFAGLHRVADGHITRYTTKDGLANDLVNEIVEDDAGSLWLSTYGGGLARYRDGRFDRFGKAEGLAADFLNTIVIDREGSLWIAMNSGGLGRIRDGLMTSYTTLDGLPDDEVRVVLEDRAGAVWFGTHDGGLARRQDGRVTTFTTNDGLPSNLVYSLAEDARGRLWVGTYNGGLSRYEGGRFRTIGGDRIARNQFVTAMQEDRDGAMWLGTYGGGLKRVVDDTITTFTKKDGLAGDSIWTMTMDPAGALWVGTWQGLTRYADGTFTTFTTKDGLPDDEIYALLPDPDGSLWVASERGLSRIRNGKVARIEPAEPIVDDTIYHILPDDRGGLWCSSNRGIYRVSRQELHDMADGRRTTLTVVRYGTADGMKTQECNGGSQPAGWRGRNGTLWFPTVRGVVAIDPTRLRDAAPPPTSVVENIIVDGASLTDTPSGGAAAGGPVAYALANVAAAGPASADGPGASTIATATVRPGSRRVEFHYTAPHLSAPERVRFRYRLDGYDSAWVEAGARRVAYYTDLTPGAHTFHVAAAVEGGAWSEGEGVVAVWVAPRFYQTWWFLTGLIAATTALLFVAHRYRVNQLVAVERVRTRIASDLHDDIGSSLSQIAILSEVVRTRVDPAAAEIAEPLERIGALSRESVDAMGDIVWAVSPDRGTPTHLSQRMRRLASDLLPSRGIQLQFESTGDAQAALGIDTRREVFLIFKEALNNSVRHAGATEVSIALDVGRRALRLVVRDNGVGFDATAGDRETDGQGLRSMTRRAAAIGGRLSIASTPGGGTTIALDAPIR